MSPPAGIASPSPRAAGAGRAPPAGIAPCAPATGRARHSATQMRTAVSELPLSRRKSESGRRRESEIPISAAQTVATVRSHPAGAHMPPSSPSCRAPRPKISTPPRPVARAMASSARMSVLPFGVTGSAARKENSAGAWPMGMWASQSKRATRACAAAVGPSAGGRATRQKAWRTELALLWSRCPISSSCCTIPSRLLTPFSC
eukprot:scaffold1591_cov109-Isochrysis_galbana.AAC.12